MKNIIFKQTRVGQYGKPFTIYKFRTMYIGADKDKKKYLHLNEGIYPAFKIHNDPRFTKFGKIISKTGLDELPQIINIFRGEMNLIGPRPLPVEEFNNLPKNWQRLRNRVKPGIISSWPIEGSHNLTKEQWYQLDKKDINNIHSIKYKLKLLWKFIVFLIKIK